MLLIKLFVERSIENLFKLIEIEIVSLNKFNNKAKILEKLIVCGFWFKNVHYYLDNSNFFLYKLFL